MILSIFQVFILDRPKSGAGPRGAGRDDPADDVHQDRLHQQLPAARGLHQGEPCLDTPAAV